MADYFADNKPLEGHGRRSARSGATSMMIRVGNAAFQFGSVLILARLLTPEDYGLVAMVMAITGFATLFVDLGSREAIARQERVTPAEVSAMFWITLGMGGGLTLLLSAIAPLIASFYGDPRLTNITVVSSLVFVTTSLACQHQALMRRAMMFQRLASIEVTAGILSGVLSILMALGGWHYWALVFRPVAMSVLIVAGVWLSCGWVPARPTVTRHVKDMIRFGVTVIGTALTEYARGNFDRIAIGWRYGAANLGQYQNALQVFSNLLDPLNYLNDVAVGSLSKLLDNLKEFRRLWTKAISLLTFFVMPAFGMLAITSQDLIILLLGSKWSSAGVILSVLALRGIPQVMERTVGWLHISAGRGDRLIRWSLFAAVIHLAGLAVGLPFGVMGVAAVSVVLTYLLFLPAVAYAGKPLGIGIKDIVSAVGRQLVGAVVSVGVGLVVRETLLSGSSSLARTLLVAGAYLVCYLVIVVGFFRMTEPLVVAWSLLRDMLPSQRAGSGGRELPRASEPASRPVGVE